MQTPPTAQWWGGVCLLLHKMGRNVGPRIHEDLNILPFPIVTEVICTPNHMLWNSHVPTLVIHLPPSVWPSKTILQSTLPSTTSYPKCCWSRCTEQPSSLLGYQASTAGKDHLPAYSHLPRPGTRAVCVTEWEVGEKQYHQHNSQGLFENGCVGIHAHSVLRVMAMALDPS